MFKLMFLYFLTIVMQLGFEMQAKLVEGILELKKVVPDPFHLALVVYLNSLLLLYFIFDSIQLQRRNTTTSVGPICRACSKSFVCVLQIHGGYFPSSINSWRSGSVNLITPRTWKDRRGSPISMQR